MKRNNLYIVITVAILCYVCMAVVQQAKSSEVNTELQYQMVENEQDSQFIDEQMCFDYPYFQDLSSMIEVADTIIEGDVVGRKSNVNINIETDESREPFIVNYDVFTVHVTNVLCGDVKVGDKIELKIRTGCNELGIDEGNAYLFALYDYRDLIPNTPFSLVALSQGAFQIENEYAIIPETECTFFENNDEPLSMGTNIKISYDELLLKINEIRN